MLHNAVLLSLSCSFSVLAYVSDMGEAPQRPNITQTPSLLNPKTRLWSCFILLSHWLQRWMDRFAGRDYISPEQEGNGRRAEGMKLRGEVKKGRNLMSKRGGWMGEGARREWGRLIKWGPCEGGRGEKGSGRGPVGGKSESVALYILRIPAPPSSLPYIHHVNIPRAWPSG